MVHKQVAALVVAVLAGAGIGRAEETPVRVGQFAFTRAAEKLPPGAVYATFQSRNLLGRCYTENRLTADGQLKPLPLSMYGPPFSREWSNIPGLSETSTNLFDPGVDTEEYEIGALIESASMIICHDRDDASEILFESDGLATLKVQWQIYSTSSRTVIATVETSGSTKSRLNGRPRLRDLPTKLLQDAFAENVKQLAASAEVSKLLNKAPSASEADKVGGQDRVSLSTATPATRAIGDAVGAVVLIDLGDGHGSGVLVSSDGYILTNAHVVGTKAKVRVRWSDGFETEGQVVRVHKARDVALVKAEPHGRIPLSIRVAPVQTSETVWAIGAPLDPNLQSTVTRGVVSANRIRDGFSFIQSDVAVNHGNSGGPLLDEKGYVVGLTQSGIQPTDDAQIGINFFIPIKDALDFLKLDLAPAPEAAKPPVQKLSGPAVARKR